MGEYVVHTDASVKKNKTWHSYCIYNKKGRFLNGRVFMSDINKSSQAEEYSIKMLLNDLEKEKIESIEIFTDNMGVKMNTESEMHQHLRQLKGEIFWIPREKNKLADKACKSGKLDFFEKAVIYDINRKLSRIPRPSGELKIGDISLRTLNEHEKEELMYHFSYIIQDLDKVNIEEIINWCEKQPMQNTKSGRKYAVKKFIEYKYGYGDITKEEKVEEDIENFKTKEDIMRKRIEFTRPPKEMSIGEISLNTIPKKHQIVMNKWYKNIIRGLDVKIYHIEEILEWAENKPTRNDKQGRRYIVKQFVQEMYGL